MKPVDNDDWDLAFEIGDMVARDLELTKEKTREIIKEVRNSISKEATPIQEQETNGRVAAHCLREMQRIFQENMKENPKTEEEIRVNLGMERYK